MIKQSSIEYLLELIRLNDKEFYAMLFDDKVIEKANQMHKEEITDAWNNGMKSDNGHFGTSEQYYQETYGSSPKTSDNGPEYDSAGFTEEDRIVNGQYRVKL